MTNTLRERALGALSVLRLTSHSDKAEILSAYIEALEFQSHVALDRMTQLMDRGWCLDRDQNVPAAFCFIHPRGFCKVFIHTHGDAEFWLKRVSQPHWIGATDDEQAFTEYMKAIGTSRR